MLAYYFDKYVAYRLFIEQTNVGNCYPFHSSLERAVVIALDYDGYYFLYSTKITGFKSQSEHHWLWVPTGKVSGIKALPNHYCIPPLGISPRVIIIIGLVICLTS